ncbi:hypothetical protein NDU88_003661 [Pleurodeles waltl]|uniref:Uncharacterized protein n=1 Tax=Pleurodeles waltl TaxID=8319 RepID=A0AAV7PCU4_PLEWA|nr:hypothetical protein NDU88_003661 [Pleurodeles waltl]
MLKDTVVLLKPDITPRAYGGELILLHGYLIGSIEYKDRHISVDESKSNDTIENQFDMCELDQFDVCELSAETISKDRSLEEVRGDATIQKVIDLISHGLSHKGQGGDPCKDYCMVKNQLASRTDDHCVWNLNRVVPYRGKVMRDAEDAEENDNSSLGKDNGSTDEFLRRSDRKTQRPVYLKDYM